VKVVYITSTHYLITTAEHDAAINKAREIRLWLIVAMAAT